MRLIPEKILTRLQEQGLSVSQCSRLANIQIDTLYDNLRTPGRRPHFKTIWRLAQALQCEVDDIAEIIEYVD